MDPVQRLHSGLSVGPIQGRRSDSIQTSLRSRSETSAATRTPASSAAMGGFLCGRTLLSIPMLLAFGLFSSPARAMPGATLQLFRVNDQGVQAVPAISNALAAMGSTTAAVATTTAAAAEPSPSSPGEVALASPQQNEATAAPTSVAQAPATPPPPFPVWAIVLAVVAVGVGVAAASGAFSSGDAATNDSSR